MLKVLMLVPNLRVSNGVASFAMNYFRLLEKSQIQMDFAIYSDIKTPYYEEIKAAGSKYFILPSVKEPLAHYRACRQILKSEKYDIVHDNTLLISIPMMQVARNVGVPVRILHSHSAGIGETPIKSKRNALFLPFLKSLATDYAACSNAAAMTMFGEKEYHFIPNIVAESRLDYSPEIRASIRKKMGVSNKLVIGTVGRMSPPKNPYFALETIKDLVKIRQDIEYWWIGSGSLDDDFKGKISEMELDGFVHFFGSREDVSAYYQAMDIFLLPSVFEGLPVTGIEAQTMGLPCVVSDNITREMVFTELVHFVSIKRHSDEWAKTIVDLLSSNNKRRSYKQELRNSPFSGKEASNNLARIYKSLIEHRDKN